MSVLPNYKLAYNFRGNKLNSTICRVKEPKVTCHCEITLPRLIGGPPAVGTISTIF